jgi:hypothetical protein
MNRTASAVRDVEIKTDFWRFAALSPSNHLKSGDPLLPTPRDQRKGKGEMDKKICLEISKYYWNIKQYLRNGRRGLNTKQNWEAVYL